MKTTKELQAEQFSRMTWTDWGYTALGVAAGNGFGDTYLENFGGGLVGITIDLHGHGYNGVAYLNPLGVEIVWDGFDGEDTPQFAFDLEEVHGEITPPWVQIGLGVQFIKQFLADQVAL